MKDMTIQSLAGEVQELDNEFRQLMKNMRLVKTYGDDRLRTFSPLDVLVDFEAKGLSRIEEPSRQKMMKNEDAFRKLLANMLQQCRPGALSDEDVNQLSGINGRGLRDELYE